MQQLSIDYIRQLVPLWLANGGSNKIELAALEPLLWQEGNMQLPHLVAELKALGCRVSLTTNGSLLARHAQALQQAGVDLVRISWHSLSAETFAQITGKNSYHKFQAGLQAAIDVGLPLAINRVLLRGHCDDLAEQIAFADRHQLRLKLLDLYWMPSCDQEYRRFYISPQAALAAHVPAGLLQQSGRQNDEHASRGRVRFNTANGGKVEYKLSAEADHSTGPCRLCPYKDNCLEGFADYLRVFPDNSVSLCYMNLALSRPLPSDAIHQLPQWLQQQGTGMQMPLRLVVTGSCNFNCGFPGSTQSWCLKQGRGFRFPPRHNHNSEVIHVQAA